MTQSYLGLDISKANIHTYLILVGRQPKHKVVVNTAEGHGELVEWLSRQSVGSLHGSAPMVRASPVRFTWRAIPSVSAIPRRFMPMGKAG